MHSSGPTTNAVYVGIINQGQLAGLFRSEQGVDGNDNDSDGQLDEHDETAWVQMDTPTTNEGGGGFGLSPRPKGGGQGNLHFSIVVN